MAVDGSEVCLSLNQLKAYCTRGGAVRAAEGMRQYPAALGIFSDVEPTTRGTGAVAKLELKFARFELYQDETSDRLEGLPAFKAEARKYITSYTEPTRQMQSGARVKGNGNFRRVAEAALKIVKGCDCVDACPKCVYSPLLRQQQDALQAQRCKDSTDSAK